MWHHTHDLPHERQLILAVINDKIVADVFVYLDGKLNVGTFNFDWASIQAWMPFKDLPEPDWLAEQINSRKEANKETVQLSSAYRAGKEDLFGNVVDPDDLATPDTSMR